MIFQNIMARKHLLYKVQKDKIKVEYEYLDLSQVLNPQKPRITFILCSCFFTNWREKKRGHQGDLGVCALHHTSTGQLLNGLKNKGKITAPQGNYGTM